MIRRIRPPHILSGELDKLTGEPYILDCRNCDIEWTIRMMIRNAPPGMVAVSLRPEIGGFAMPGAEREARRRGARIIWLPVGRSITGGRSHYADFFSFGWFSSHSGFQLPWKVDCDALCERDWEGLAKLVAWKFAFRSVYGIPRGGSQFARALDKHVDLSVDGKGRHYPVLIVDDVLTTGRSFEQARLRLGPASLTEEGRRDFIGVVVFARGRCPDWVWPIFSVNEWAQSRATGLG